jgi:hypothetical protein
MRRTSAILTLWCPLIVATNCACGCSWLKDWKWERNWPAVDRDAQETTVDNRSPDASADSRTSANTVAPDFGDTTIVNLRFEVTRFIAPTDNLIDTRDRIWMNVEELRIPPAQAEFLNRNGIRLGVVRDEGCDAMQKALSRAGARAEKITHDVRSGAPLTLDLGPAPGRNSIFVFQRNGAVAGKSIENAVRLLHVDYESVLSATTEMTLRITPELFKQSNQPHWQIRDGDVAYRKQYEGIAFHDLAVEINLRAGETLVIGPSDLEKNKHSVGAKIFGEMVGSSRWENVLWIRPRLFRTANEQG